jgi:hypothetical protein
MTEAVTEALGAECRTPKGDAPTVMVVHPSRLASLALQSDEH